jgi:hypothetical protein
MQRARYGPRRNTRVMARNEATRQSQALAISLDGLAEPVIGAHPLAPTERLAMTRSTSYLCRSFGKIL